MDSHCTLGAVVYDIEVEEDHSFVAEGFVVHNCTICGALDGQMFAVGEGPMPAAHPNCRCTRVPVLKSWKELGISLSEAPPGTRASMNGQVSEKLTFADWIEQEPAAIQDEILGPARAKLLRAGELSLGDFVDERRGRILTLQQIAALQHPN